MSAPLTPAREGRTRGGRRWILRPTRGEDVPALVALRDAVAAEGDLITAVPGERTSAEEGLLLVGLRSEGGLSLTLEIDSEVAAHLVCQRRSAPWERHVGELAIIVANSQRRNGLGRQLMLAAIDWARSEGLSKLVLSVYPDNHPALRLYAGIGFLEEGRQRNQVRIGGRAHDLVLMGLVL